jgi:hypothetical protein
MGLAAYEASSIRELLNILTYLEHVHKREDPRDVYAMYLTQPRDQGSLHWHLGGRVSRHEFPKRVFESRSAKSVP